MNWGMAVSATSGYSLNTQNAKEGRLGRYVGSSLKRQTSLNPRFRGQHRRKFISEIDSE
jgi:hypothetical protein